MAFSGYNISIYFWLLVVFVPLCSTAAIREVEQLHAQSKVQITFHYKNETLDGNKYGNDIITNFQSHSWICYYTVLPSAMIFYTVVLLKICYKAKKNKWCLKFLHSPSANTKNQSQQQARDVELGTISNTHAIIDCSYDRYYETSTIKVNSTQAQSSTLPDVCPIVLLEGDALVKRAYAIIEDDLEELWYPDNKDIFKPVQQDDNDAEKCEESFKIEYSGNSHNVSNSIYEQYMNIMMPQDSFDYDQEVDTINCINYDDDYFGLKNLGAMYCF